MICLRCGWCCQHLCVVLPDGTAHWGLGKDCKFLTWEGSKATCTVHGKDSRIETEDGLLIVTPWEETPCGRHGQIGRPGAECRMGRYQLDRRDDDGVQHHDSDPE